MPSSKRVPSPELPEHMRQGWETGRRNFGNRVHFFAPSLKRYSTGEFTPGCRCSFPPVSLTGVNCALRCDHCRAEILKWMQPAATPRALLAAASDIAARGAAGMLISGGSDRKGVVPLSGFLAAIREARLEYGLKIIVHTGVTDAALAVGLAEAGVTAALIDIIGSDAAIRDVCHMTGVTTADYDRSLENLCQAGVPCAPHVVIGLEHGAVAGEYEALKMISRHDVECVVLVGLLPMRGTPMEAVQPPSPEEMAEIFLAARKMFARIPVMLGCERPVGEHKLQTDRLALQAGLNGIAYPAEGIIGLATEMGLEPVALEVCCAAGLDSLMTDLADGIGATSTPETNGKED